MKFKHFLIGLILLLIFFLTGESIRKERKTDVPGPNFQLNHFFLNNDVLEVGVNLNWGGAIDFISYFGGPNIVDRGIPDPGRAIQVSLYDGDDYYEPNKNWTGQWGWNPVQAGDRYLNVSGAMDYHAETQNLIYTKCAPLEWNGTGVSDIILEQWVSLEHEIAIRISYKITHIGDDSHAASRQEFPCVYLKIPFIVPSVVVYQEDFPWTNDNIKMFQQKVNAGELIYSTENWVSLVDYQGYGITLFTQTKDKNWFNLERWQKEEYFPMNLIAAHTIFGLNDPDSKSNHNFPTNIYEVTVFLIFGHWQEARKIIYTEHFKKEMAQLK